MPVFGVGVELDVWGEGRGWLRISDRSRYDPSSCLGSNRLRFEVDDGFYFVLVVSHRNLSCRVV